MRVSTLASPHSEFKEPSEPLERLPEVYYRPRRRSPPTMAAHDEVAIENDLHQRMSADRLTPTESYLMRKAEEHAPPARQHPRGSAAASS